MNIRMSERYKSIRNFEWMEVPMFAVITGPNGSGKTHLLQLLGYSLVEGKKTSRRQRAIAQISGVSLNPSDVVHVPGSWQPLAEPSKVTLHNIQQFSGQLWKQVQDAQARSGRKPEDMKRLEQYLGKPVEQITEADIVERVDIRSFRPNRDLFKHELSEVFHDYFIRQVQCVEREGMSKKDFVSIYGPPPWRVLEEILNASDLPFSFSSPPHMKLWDSYQFQLIHTLHDTPIKLSDLSSGERVLFSLVLWLFSSQENGQFPKLLLLDEPDAHLHASMTRRFLETVESVLVQKHGVRVIMTTHSPSTVALAPLESVFELSPPGPKIERVESREHAIARLTAGFITVMKTVRHVLVEDESDRDFYETVFQLCVDDDYLDPTVSLTFVPASAPTRRGCSGEDGGRAEVVKIVQRFAQTDLGELVRGLVDRDSAPPDDSSGIVALQRYCIENYLTDPIVIFGALLEMRYLDIPPEIAMSYGQEPLIRAGTKPLQPIVDWVADKLGMDTTSLVEVDYKPKGAAKLSQEFFDTSGKDILRNAIDTFGGTYVNEKLLKKAFARVRLVPSELIDTLGRLQECTPAQSTATPG